MTTLRMISGITYTRKNLEALTGMPDRENRRMIREQRRQGVPIVAMKDGGYKLAETEEEKQALLFHVPQAGIGRAGDIPPPCQSYAGGRADGDGRWKWNGLTLR